jgi:hypothetical protein
MEYKIEVKMTPHTQDNPEAPYFWIIKSDCGDGWCTNTAGWAVTPEEAWKEAYAFYTKYLMRK